jgi:hypothetical protein|tara:strand:- start:174 stop:473 length:300 start_codon:yes stop_codon:yes gene_type:complete
MNHVNFTFEEELNKVSVFVVVAEQRNYPLVPIINITTQDVLDHLAENGIKVGPLEHAPVVHNRRNHHLKGTWVFAKKAPAPPKPKTRRKRTSIKKLTEE